jgi:polar amino acid transport system substrate-binding protein
MFTGCQTTRLDPDPSMLRVGVTPRSQPMVFKQGGEIAGIEADFARRLGEALNRKVVFVEVPWEKQIDYLEQNRTDIIMSNMSITAPRSMRINFTTPYMQSGLSGLFRRDNYDPAGLVASTIRNQNKRVGFVENTTGAFYCRQRFTRAKLEGYPSPADGVTALKANKVDMFVHDAPLIWWNSAVNEAELVAFYEVLSVEPLAWGIRKSNLQLLDQVNALIAQWQKDGTSDRIIKNWIPAAGQ